MFCKINRVGHAIQEKIGAKINRRFGTTDYLFLHFWNPVCIEHSSETIITNQNACIIYSPGTPQWYTTYDAPMDHDYFHFDCDDNLFSTYGIPLNTVFYVTEKNFITGIIRELKKDFICQDKFWEKNIDIAINQLFIKLSRSLINTENSKNSIRMVYLAKQFKKLRMEMLQTLDYQWTVVEMAKRLNLSPAHFSFLYQSFFGCSPMRDLTIERLNHSQYLLSGCNYLVCEIASMVGYSNQFSFIRSFKKEYGIPPGKYASNHMKQGIIQEKLNE